MKKPSFYLLLLLLFFSHTLIGQISVQPWQIESKSTTQITLRSNGNFDTSSTKFGIWVTNNPNHRVSTDSLSISNVNVVSDSVILFNITVPQRYIYKNYYINYLNDSTIASPKYQAAFYINSPLKFQPQLAYFGDTVDMQIASKSKFYQSPRNKLFLTTSFSLTDELIPIQWNILDSSRISAQFVIPHLLKDYYLIYMNDTLSTDTIFNYDPLLIRNFPQLTPDNAFSGEKVKVLMYGKNFFPSNINKVFIKLTATDTLVARNLKILSKDTAIGTFDIPKNALAKRYSIYVIDTNSTTNNRFYYFFVKNVERRCGQYTWPINKQTYSSTGLYYDTIINDLGFKSQAELNLEINPVPVADIVQGEQTAFCGKDSVKLSNRSSSHNYNWYKIDSVKHWKRLDSIDDPYSYNQLRSIFSTGNEVYLVEHQYDVNVYKKTNYQWEQIGSHLGNSTVASMDFDNGTPYLAIEGKDGLEMLKWDGVEWSSIGDLSAWNSIGVFNVVLKIYNGTPYIAFNNTNNGRKISVIKFDGTDWVNVGNPSFSSGNTVGISMDFKNGVPVVFYNDRGTKDFGTVVTLLNKKWITLGTIAFTGHRVYYPSIKIHNNIPYIAYNDVDNQTVRVQQYTGGKWTNIWSHKHLYYPKLQIHQGKLFVGSIRSVKPDRYLIHSYDGSQWKADSSGVIINLAKNYRSFGFTISDHGCFFAYNIEGTRVPISHNLGSGVLAYDYNRFVGSGNRIFVKEKGLYVLYSNTFSKCNSADSIEVVDHIQLDTSINLSADTLFTNEKNVDSYQWVDCKANYQIISGETKSHFKPTKNGEYAVVLNNGSCTDTSTCYTFKANTINEAQQNQSFKIHPNPTNGNIFLSTEGGGVVIGNVLIYDLQGNIVINKEIQENNESIDLGMLKGGVYFIRYQSSVQKLIINK